jgi:lipopolysaccharide export system permease protein
VAPQVRVIGRLLDRYTLGLWLRLFGLTVLGFPIVSILINLTDSLNKLLDRGLTVRQIIVSYMYSIPENMFLVLPAAVLFATVFTVGTMARHSELTAAKAGGQSFRRLMLPIFLVSVLASGLGIVVGEMAPGATAKQLKLQKAQPEGPTSARFNFVYRADQGWVYTIRSLEIATRKLKTVLFERQGTGIRYPDLVVTADSATYDNQRRAWRLWNGTSRVIASPVRQASFRFRTLRLRSFTQTPADLLAEAKAPDEMRYGELGRYIEALQRSGNDANKLVVERALKLAIPATCLIIAIFGAPLAITSPRAGTAFGIAISLATTVLFLLLMQIAKAVGAGGLVDPTAAAWIPNGVFLLIGAALLVRART